MALVAASAGTVAVLVITLLALARYRPELAVILTRRAAAVVLIVWPVVLVAMTVLGTGTVDQGIILVPLRDLSSMTTSIMLTNALGNIGLFLVPSAAVRIYFGSRYGPARTVVVAAVVSVSIELLQLLTGRNVSIDDVWLNTLGAALGFLLGGMVVHMLVRTGESHSSP